MHGIQINGAISCIPRAFFGAKRFIFNGLYARLLASMRLCVLTSMRLRVHTDLQLEREL